jgi:hypothetical protein
MNQRRKTISRVVAVLAVLVSIAAFSANPAYAQFPGAGPTVTQQYATGSTPSLTVPASTDEYTVVLGFNAICTVPAAPASLPLVQASVTTGDSTRTWPILGSISGSSIAYSSSVPGVLPPGTSVAIATVDPGFVSGAVCENTVTLETGSYTQMEYETTLRRQTADAGLNFWFQAANGSSPSLVAVLSAEQASVISRVDAVCTASTSLSNTLLQITLTSGSSIVTYAVPGALPSPNVLVWKGGLFSNALPAGGNVSVSLVAPIAGAQCSIGIAGVMGAASQIQQFLLSRTGAPGTDTVLERPTAPPNLAAFAGTGPGKTHSFTLSASQPAFLYDLTGFCTAPSPGFTSNQLAVVSIVSGGVTTYFPILLQKFGSEAVFFDLGSLPVLIDAGTTVTLTASSALPASTQCFDAAIGLTAASNVIGGAISNNY